MTGSDEIQNSGNTLHGIGLMTLAMLIIPCMDIVAKYLSATIAPLEIAFCRFIFQTLFALIFILLFSKLTTLRGIKLVPQFLRGFFLAGATLLFFSAIQHMPVANAIAIFFVEPLILTALSAIMLKEPVGLKRWGAVVVGFIGALFILRPGILSFGWHALLPLGTAFLFALYIIFTRRLSTSGTMLTIQFYTGLSGSLLLGIILLFTSLLKLDGFIATVPNQFEFLLLAVVGVFSFVCHGLIVLAAKNAPAAVIAPLSYIEIVSATFFGYLVFGDFPDNWTWLGIAIVIASGLYVAHRERQQQMLA